MCKFGAHPTSSTRPYQKFDAPRRHFRHGENGSRLRFLEISRKIPRYRTKITVLGTYRRKPADFRARRHPTLNSSRWFYRTPPRTYPCRTPTAGIKASSGPALGRTFERLGPRPTAQGIFARLSSGVRGRQHHVDSEVLHGNILMRDDRQVLPLKTPSHGHTFAFFCFSLRKKKSVFSSPDLSPFVDKLY